MFQRSTPHQCSLVHIHICGSIVFIHVKLALAKRSLGPVYEFVCISFKTDNLNCFRTSWTMAVKMVNAARTRIRDETSETDHTQKWRFRHGANHKKLWPFWGAYMVQRWALLGVVIWKCETPTTNISQENGHGTQDYMSICGLQLEINSSGPILVFFPKYFLIGTYLVFV